MVETVAGEEGKGREQAAAEKRAQPQEKKLQLMVQGKKLSYFGPPDIRSLLESQGENSLYANVRINGEILDRRDFENIQVNDGDEIDFLYFMGGGMYSSGCLGGLQCSLAAVRNHNSSWLLMDNDEDR